MILHRFDAGDRLRRHHQRLALGRVGNIAAQFDIAIPHDDIDLRQRRPGFAVIDGESALRMLSSSVGLSTLRLGAPDQRPEQAGPADHADELPFAHDRDEMQMLVFDQRNDRVAMARILDRSPPGLSSSHRRSFAHGRARILPQASGFRPCTAAKPVSLRSVPSSLRRRRSPSVIMPTNWPCGIDDRQTADLVFEHQRYRLDNRCLGRDRRSGRIHDIGSLHCSPRWSISLASRGHRPPPDETQSAR